MFNLLGPLIFLLRGRYPASTGVTAKQTSIINPQSPLAAVGAFLSGHVASLQSGYIHARHFHNYIRH